MTICHTPKWITHKIEIWIKLWLCNSQKVYDLFSRILNEDSSLWFTHDSNLMIYHLWWFTILYDGQLANSNIVNNGRLRSGRLQRISSPEDLPEDLPEDCLRFFCLSAANPINLHTQKRRSKVESEGKNLMIETNLESSGWLSTQSRTQSSIGYLTVLCKAIASKINHKNFMRIICIFYKLSKFESNASKRALRPFRKSCETFARTLLARSAW